MKKFYTLLLSALTLTGTGCAHFNEKPATDNPTGSLQICQELKRNIVFSKSSGPNFGDASSTQVAEMYRLYEKYHCNDTQKNK
jgi:hypothetical protein